MFLLKADGYSRPPMIKSEAPIAQGKRCTGRSVFRPFCRRTYFVRAVSFSVFAVAPLFALHRPIGTVLRRFNGIASAAPFLPHRLRCRGFWDTAVFPCRTAYLCRAALPHRSATFHTAPLAVLYRLPLCFPVLAVSGFVTFRPPCDF